LGEKLFAFVSSKKIKTMMREARKVEMESQNYRLTT
jgi:hypothetical protein